MKVARLLPVAIFCQAVCASFPRHCAAQPAQPPVVDTIAFIWAGIEEGAKSVVMDANNSQVCVDRWRRVAPGAFEAVEESCASGQIDDSRFKKLKITKISSCKYYLEDSGTVYVAPTVGRSAEQREFSDRILLDFSRVQPWQTRRIPPAGVHQPMLLGKDSICLDASCIGTRCIFPVGCDDGIKTRFVATTEAELSRWHRAVLHLRKTACAGLPF